MNKLDAVNSCLRGIGAQPVSSLDDPNLDAGLAQQVIDGLIPDILSRGWWFNREPNWNLSPDPSSGYIKVPNNAIDIITAGGSRSDEVTIRGDKLYDIVNHTFNMTSRLDKDGKLNCTFIITLPFDEMPIVARRAVTYISRRLFAQDLEADATRWNFQSRDEVTALSALERAEAQQKKHNYRNNPVVGSFISRVGGRNSAAGLRTNYRGSRGGRT